MQGVMSALKQMGAGFVGKHRYFESDTRSFGKPITGAQQWGGGENLGRLEKSCAAAFWIN